MQVADPDRRIDPASRQGGHHRAGEIAFLQRPDAGAGPRHLGDELLVARPLEDGDGEVLHPDVSGKRDSSQVVDHRIVQVDRAPSPRTGDELLDLRGGGHVGKSARLDRDQQRDRVDVPARDLARALDRVHAQVDLAPSTSDHKAMREMRLVARAQDHGGGQPRLLERGAHGVPGGIAHAVRVSFAEEPGARKRRGLGRMHELERQLALRV